MLRRAAELEARREAGEGGSDRSEDGLPVGDLVRLGEEAGVGSDAIMRALREMRQGALVPAPETGALVRTLGPSRLVVTRDVPGPAPPIERAVERFLREQLMTVRRHHGERVEWERARGLWPGLARSLDFGRRYAYAPVSRVETAIAPDDDGATSVTFAIDLSEVRRDRMTRVALRASAAFALVGLGGAAVFPGFGINDVLALFSGGAAAGGLFALERKRYQETRERVELATERFLDLLVQRRRRALGRAGAVDAPPTPTPTQPGMPFPGEGLSDDDER